MVMAMAMRKHQQKGNQSLLPSRAVGKASKSSPPFDTLTWIICLLLSCFISFYAGVWMGWTLATPPNCHDDTDSSSSTARVLNHDSPGSQDASSSCVDMCLSALIGGKKGELARKLDGKLDAIIEQALETRCPAVLPSHEGGGNTGSKMNDKRFSGSLNHFANGLVKINRKDLFDTFDFGVPMNPGAEREDVLMLYDSRTALPSDTRLAHEAEYGGKIPHTDAVTATSNCDRMNVVFMKNPSRPALRQCFALVGGQFQSYHIQKWMRLVGEGAHGKVDPNAPLRVTGRMTRASGYDEMYFAKRTHVEEHQDLMLKYLSNVNQIRHDLFTIISKMGAKKAVVVSTVNKGQSDLLVNFVCSARARGLDLGNFLVFPTDLHSKQLAEGLGIATYYSEPLMASIPTSEAARYGDSTFAKIMVAKVISVYLVVELGYDVLFQDVDVVWFKDPVKFFNGNPQSAIANFDVYFQDDGNREERYAPYSANSGFYYIRNNERTKLLFRTMMYSSDLIHACRSHQQILISMLAENNSLTGLKVKVLSRDGDDFPGGYHYHMDRNYMKKFVKGEKAPYIFHMCWTLNKDDKLKFLRQMGMWYVNDHCEGNNDCCSAKPVITCYYRDKPSIKSCADSPPKDKGAHSFW
mmetsp:Transcript_45068/g.94502  ORF Transcript_45068/g.94502 Transcript_45068/m.94502 type:complete len:636 (-) Transcript_45068:263-2170(-)